MVELELLGLHGDGEHLTLTDDDGRRYRLSIDDTLRAAVRRDRPHLEALRAAGESPLRPKDIQALVRAGASAEEVAEVSGLSPEHVRRYEGPVLAEREWVVQQAQGHRVGRESDAPRLGDLVLDRLAARGVATGALAWDAVRRQGEPWEVVVTFVAGGREREARWQVDLPARSVHALDDEARWLSETEVGPGAHPRRHLSPVGAGRAGVQDLAPERRPRRDEPAEPAEPAEETRPERSETDNLLAELAAHRGTRLELQPELEPDDDEGGALWDAPGAHPPASRPEEATDAHVLALPRRAVTQAETGPGTTPALPAGGRPGGEDVQVAPDDRDVEAADRSSGGPGPAPDGGHAGRQPRRQRRSSRRSVPSWDEIVFGARPE
ncbi:septation protein SepH [Georgenia sp. M64]|uniref:septation protein SepH n=1 Tax=Georgenia sp. M64 TaxID=3120520 RepID=UPI0030DEDA49